MHTLLNAAQREFEAEELTYWGIGKTDNAFMHALDQWRNSVGLPPHRSIPTGTVFAAHSVIEDQA